MKLWVTLQNRPFLLYVVRNLTWYKWTFKDIALASLKALHTLYLISTLLTWWSLPEHFQCLTFAKMSQWQVWSNCFRANACAFAKACKISLRQRSNETGIYSQLPRTPPTLAHLHDMHVACFTLHYISASCWVWRIHVCSCLVAERVQMRVFCTTCTWWPPNLSTVHPFGEITSVKQAHLLLSSTCFCKCAWTWEQPVVPWSGAFCDDMLVPSVHTCISHPFHYISFIPTCPSIDDIIIRIMS